MKTLINIKVSKRFLKRLFYSLLFLIPLTVRSIPELQTSVPIGFDTPIYLTQAKEMAGNSSIYPLYSRLLALLYSSGIDLLIFMKIFPVLTYAGTIFFASAYAERRLGWSWSKTLILVFLMTFSAPMLRMSWDLHRQNLGTFLIILAVYLDLYANPRPEKTLCAVSLNAAIGLLQEITLTVATVIPFYSATKEFLNGKYSKSIQLFIISATPLASYELGLLSCGGYFLPTHAIENAILAFGSYESVVSQQIGIFLTFFWALAPLAILGFFSDPVLNPWLLITATTGFSRILFPWMSMRQSDRWMLYMTIPLAFYASNAVFKLIAAEKQPLIKLGTCCAVLFLASTQGIGMIGFIPFQSRFFVNGFIHLMPTNMVFSTAYQHHVETVIRFVDLVNAQGSCAIVTHDPWFYYWAKYRSRTPVIPFSSEKEIPSAIGKARESGYSVIYVIWFDTYMESPVIRENQLALYKIGA